MFEYLNQNLSTFVVDIARDAEYYVPVLKIMAAPGQHDTDEPKKTTAKLIEGVVGIY